MSHPLYAWAEMASRTAMITAVYAVVEQALGLPGTRDTATDIDRSSVLQAPPPPPPPPPPYQSASRGHDPGTPPPPAQNLSLSGVQEVASTSPRLPAISPRSARRLQYLKAQALMAGRPAPPPPPPPPPAPLQPPPYQSTSIGIDAVTPPTDKKARESKLLRVRNGRVVKKWDKKPKTVKRIMGLPNSGNACYRLAMLQCLFSLPEFVAYLEKLRSEKCYRHYCATCSLKDLLAAYSQREDMESLESRVIAFERAIKQTIPEKHPLAEFINKKRDRQADTWDFLWYLRDVLQAAERPEDEVTWDDLFEVNTRTEWTCEDCGRVKKETDSVTDPGAAIGVNVRIRYPERGLSVLEYMRRAEYKPRPVEQRCDSPECLKRYGHKDTKTWDGLTRQKTKYVLKAPEILVVHLDRIVQTEDWWKSQDDVVRSGDHVHFDEHLNLGEFTETGQSIMYRLEGVVAHAGRNYNSGHYISAIRVGNKREFRTINDKAVGKSKGGTLEELQKPRGSGEGASDFAPVLLFYTRI